MAQCGGSLHRHPREGGDPVGERDRLVYLWIPAFAGKTEGEQDVDEYIV